ncbi:MAG: hypothetical protein OXB96_00880 [Candidatus Kaiserbacteria bacterium]|nr:hypothetical protein [Candidatus Kaiserbacteria bacterium]
MQEITCESLEQQYQVLQDTADEYRAVLMSEGSDSEKAKELRTSFATETERLRENIVLYKEQQEGIFYLSAEYRSGAAYIEALKEKGGRVLSSAKDLLNQLTTIPEEQVRLKKVTLKDLGLPDSSTPEEVFKAAEAQGLKPCPPWVGPQYGLVHATEEYETIFTEPLDSSHVDAFMFFRTLNDSRGLFLAAPSLEYWYNFSPDGKFVFISDK